MIEEFKTILGFEPYQISNTGKLRRHGVVLSTPIGRVGYKRKYLKDLRKNILIHRAIALCFIPNPEGLKEVNHIDGNKTNNEISNLEWISRKGNAQHAFRIGLMHDQRGEKGPRAKLSQIQVAIIREALSSGHKQSKIASYFRLHQSTISLIKSNINWVSC